MRSNFKMQKYLDELEGTKLQAINCNIDFTIIESIIFPTFIEWDGCVLLKQIRNVELPIHFTANQFITDRTAFEADYNHVHLNEMFDNVLQSNQIFKIATKILDVWAAVLHRQFSTQKKFCLILSYDGEDVVLRFYSVKNGETPWLDIFSIESYVEGLMIVEI